MNIKYYEQRKRSSGAIAHVVNPPKYVKEATGASYQQFDDRELAVNYALEVAEGYQEYKRGKREFRFLDQSTTEGLARFYMTTKEFKELGKGTKIHYRNLIKTALSIRIGTSSKTVGEMYARNISAMHVNDFYLQVKEDRTATIAFGCMKVMRRIFTVGKRYGRVTGENPWAKAGMKSLPSRVVVWEPEHVDMAIEQADKMGLSSMGTLILMGYHLCQRPGDMRQMTWGQYKNGCFTFVQEKTGVQVEIDASPMLKARIDAMPRGADDETIVKYERTGRPYIRSMVSVVFAEVREASGIPSTLHLADLRRTGATEMAESGCTEDELRAVTGHQSRDILKVYVRPSRHMARAGINKRFQK